MFLKTLTLRGFKSFASATTLSLEPGITAVVGPNGSGKSNVVDALAWVMGEQGAKNLRGGQMADVIFAGTSGRAALGRAQVELTIDNTDGALPIEYSEVTISRTLFRGGGSEYSINGTPARLLDVQELLSDTGMGRQMHVIVGQGQLDAILSSTPEERRGFIEEAAGVLKHRRRKERAVKKLADTDANLVRVLDVSRELARQLKPLARQAQAARKASVIQARVRDASARLLADDLVAALERLAAQSQADDVLEARHHAITQAIEELRRELARVEAQHEDDTPRIQSATQSWQLITGLTERLRATLMTAQDRASQFAVQSLPPSGEDPDELDRRAEDARLADRDLMAKVEEAHAHLNECIEARRQAEDADEAAAKELARIHRIHADQRETLARLTGDVAAAQSRVEAAQQEEERAQAALAAAMERAEAADRELAAVGEHSPEGEDSPAASAHSAAVAARDAARQRVDELLALERAAQAERARWESRRDTLKETLTPSDATAHVVGLDGILGTVPELMTITPGWENAVAAALSPFADAAVAATWDDARRATTVGAEHGSVRLLIAGPDQDQQGRGDLPAGALWAWNCVTVEGSVASAVGHILSGVALIEDLAFKGLNALITHPQVRLIVTRAGDIIDQYSLLTSGEGASSVLAIQAQYAQAVAHYDEAAQVEQEAKAALVQATTDLDACIMTANAALKALREYDAEQAAAAQHRARLSSTAQSARSEAQRSQDALARAREHAEWAAKALEQAEHRRQEYSAEDNADQQSVEDVQRLADRATQTAREAREGETQARLQMRALEEESRNAQARARSLRAAAAKEREARHAWQRQEQGRQQRFAIASAVVEQAEYALDYAQKLAEKVEEERQAAEAERTAHLEATVHIRQEIDRRSQELAEVTAAIHRDRVAQTEMTMRVEQLRERALNDLHIDPEDLITEYGPHNLVPDWSAMPDDASTPGKASPAGKGSAADKEAEGASSEEEANIPDGAETATSHTDEADTAEDAPDIPMLPYVRAEQEAALVAARNALERLGKINPLALEEHAALAARHDFLVAQVNDIKKSQADLMTIITDVDRLVEEAFRSAFEDTARQFEHTFDVLFPGGQGRMVLTDPDDMLSTGIEIEARPAGKKVKRLSLLSGGERSLAAMAFLIAIFQARPSPFYVMDEVEAALDDVNLSRLLNIFRELQESSQLIIITHQKRTMEIADALYGVTMREGVTRVVSQRMSA